MSFWETIFISQRKCLLSFQLEFLSFKWGMFFHGVLICDFQRSGPNFQALRMKACLHILDSHHIVNLCGTVAKYIRRVNKSLKELNQSFLRVFNLTNLSKFSVDCTLRFLNKMRLWTILLGEKGMRNSFVFSIISSYRINTMLSRQYSSQRKIENSHLSDVISLCLTPNLQNTKRNYISISTKLNVFIFLVSLIWHFFLK